MCGILSSANNERLEGVSLNFLSSMSRLQDCHSLIYELLPKLTSTYLNSSVEDLQKSSLEVIFNICHQQEAIKFFLANKTLAKLRELLEGGDDQIKLLCLPIFEKILRFLPSDESLLIESKLKKILPQTQNEEVKFGIEQALFKNGIAEAPKTNPSKKKKKKSYFEPLIVRAKEEEKVMPRFTVVSPQYESSEKGAKQTVEQIAEEEEKEAEGDSVKEIVSDEKKELEKKAETAPVVDEPKEMLVKCVLEEEVRYIKVSKTMSFEQLSKRIDEKFSSEEKLQIKYNDPEGSEVTLLDDESVEIAFAQFPNGFTVLLKKQPKKEEYFIPAAPEFDSNFASTIAKTRLATAVFSMEDHTKERRVPKQSVAIYGKENSDNLLMELKNVLANRKKK